MNCVKYEWYACRVDTDEKKKEHEWAKEKKPTEKAQKIWNLQRNSSNSFAEDFN